jgi:hypothetical protein
VPKNLRTVTTRHRTSHFRQDLRPNSRQNYWPAQIDPKSDRLLGVVLMLVAVGADLFKTMYAAVPLEKKLAALEEDLTTRNKLINDLNAKLTEADALKAQIKGEVGGFSMIEDVKIAFIIGDSMPKGNAKDTLLTMVRSICNGSQNLKAILELPRNSQACVDVERAIQKP